MNHCPITFMLSSRGFARLLLLRLGSFEWRYRRTFLGQSLPHCKQGELDTIADKKLVEDSCHVVLYGELADAKLFRDFIVAQPLHYRLHDFHFPCSEAEVG